MIFPVKGLRTALYRCSYLNHLHGESLHRRIRRILGVPSGPRQYRKHDDLQP
jgi:hypothetical protein